VDRLLIEQKLNDSMSRILRQARSLFANSKLRSSWRDHEDLVNDTIVKALENADKIDRNFDGWAAQTQRHLYWGYFRKPAEIQPDEEIEKILHGVLEQRTPEQDASVNEFQRFFLDYAHQLPGKQKVIALAVFEGMAAKEIVKISGLKKSQVHARIGKVKAYLAELRKLTIIY